MNGFALNGMRGKLGPVPRLSASTTPIAATSLGRVRGLVVLFTLLVLAMMLLVIVAKIGPPFRVIGFGVIIPVREKSPGTNPRNGMRRLPPYSMSAPLMITDAP